MWHAKETRVENKIEVGCPTSLAATAQERIWHKTFLPLHLPTRAHALRKPFEYVISTGRGRVTLWSEYQLPAPEGVSMQTTKIPKVTEVYKVGRPARERSE